MTITEPATLLTDYLLAGFTGILAQRLFDAARRRQDAALWWWGVAFTAAAVAGLTGGTVHGFRLSMGPALTGALWLVAVESLIVAGFAVVRAALLGSRLTPMVIQIVSWVTAADLAVYGAWVATNPRFVFAMAAYGAALVVLAAVKGAAWKTSRAARQTIAAVLVSAAAAGVQQSGWAIHPQFNHNDLYHVIQAYAVWLLYRGALGDVQEPQTVPI